MVAKTAQLPELLRQTITWDQGREMTNHAATALEIYFCDPHSPWQRGSNENTVTDCCANTSPTGIDLSVHGAGYLDYVAAELSTRAKINLKNGRQR